MTVFGDVRFDSADECGYRVFLSKGEQACFWLRVGFVGVVKPNGTVGDLDVWVHDGDAERLSIPVTQIPELIASLQHQYNLATAAKAEVEAGAR
ncbi:hypothetical protein [Rhodococcus aetherivorans]|uniref:hypothetical protein n=1 Tax=Rhodococcus aetherivorans TaxID=191292 RepID=UPI00241DB9D9|nr:hypothetical protein [Rhodococcus aetherivorans]WFS13806.1 hypothetical protein P9K37_01415 [Rhodococcus aetherivorans]